MPDVLMLALALVLGICGMAWFALSMNVHWQQVRGDATLTGKAALVMRILGIAALVASLLFYLRVDHGSMASLVWIMSVTAAALIVAFTLTWRPSLLSWLAPPARR